MQMRAVLSLLAPAKINVTLEVLARRDDGYHALRSVMIPVGLYDRIEIEPAGEHGAAFRVDDATLARDNLVLRALAAAGIDTPLRVRLDKRIPIGGGLGGGSSDAAAVLRAAMAGTFGASPHVDWLAAARSLGSDVPFFLCGTGALVEGTGERVIPLGAMPQWWTVVVRPHATVATAQAYETLAALRARDGAPPTRARTSSVSLEAVDALQRADFRALHGALSNDFDDPIRAAYPPIELAARALETAGAQRALLSGSGSCVFALFETELAARAVATRIAPAAVESSFVAPFHRDDAWR